MAGQEPALAQKDPKAYYLWLQTQGLSPLQAVQQVQERFGAPKSPEQIQKEAADQQFKNQLAQTGGQLIGTVGGAYLGSQIAGIGSAAGTAGAAGAAGAGAAGAGAAGAGAAGAGAAGAGAAGAGAAGAGAAGAGAAGAGTAGTAGASTTLGSMGAVAWPVALAIGTISNAWESGMKDIVRGRGDRADWANQGVNIATGFLPNTALRLLGKPSIGRMMTSGKSDAQLLRDDFRGLLKETGVADNDYNVTLADGSQFNIGLDGKTKYQNVGENIDKKKTRNAWDVDFSNPLAEFAVKQINPMIQNIYKGADGKLNIEQYTGMLVNAATSNAKSQDDVIANINAMLGKSTFAKQAGVALPEMPKGRQVAPIAKTPQVSTPEGKAKSMSIRDVLKQNIDKD
jgi:hypothetical protein